jgi:hypothetical protein
MTHSRSGQRARELRRLPFLVTLAAGLIAATHPLSAQGGDTAHLAPVFASRTLVTFQVQNTGTAPSDEGWIARHPVVFGTVVGAGGGVVLQATSCGKRPCRVGPAGLLLGSGAGAYGGLIGSAIHNARHHRPVTRRTKIGIVAGAIGAAVGVFVACYGAGGCGGVS